MMEAATTMEFRVNITLEVDQVGNALVVQRPVPIQLVHKSGQWRAQCASPRVATPGFDTMEEAVIAAAKEATAELQAEVDERPLILGRITPDDIPKEMF